MAALFQANHRVLQELVELSTTAAQGGVRACAGCHSAALDTAREIPGRSGPGHRCGGPAPGPARLV